ncbi:hypothetical protein MUK42_35345 [Musa troglodytarum]|uniref:Uncharacterized protein n=1 Tax=Musa troglodytarum TaxID=320322 RepID=A0A9E7I5X9_9LILI|nr:hypothetical protein MUK42_35345 [Musa troglodytarum]
MSSRHHPELPRMAEGCRAMLRWSATLDFTLTWRWSATLGGVASLEIEMDKLFSWTRAGNQWRAELCYKIEMDKLFSMDPRWEPMQSGTLIKLKRFPYCQPCFWFPFFVCGTDPTFLVHLWMFR